MKRTPVDSSQIASIGYDAEEKVLEVEFNNKAVYAYSDVPKAVFDELLLADSVGKTFNATVRNQYDYERIE